MDPGKSVMNAGKSVMEIRRVNEIKRPGRWRSDLPAHLVRAAITGWERFIQFTSPFVT